MPNPIDPSSFNAFQERYAEDVEQGNLKPLQWYLKRFPECAEEVARQYMDQETKIASVEAPSSVAQSPTDAAASVSIGPYLIEEEIGRGGQGIVYRARHARTDRIVALKVLRGVGVLDDRVLAYFKREAMIAAKVDHPGLCPVYDADADSGVPYIAMRFLPGETLAQRLAFSTEGGETHALSSFVSLETDALGTHSETQAESGGRDSQAAGRRELGALLRIMEKICRALGVAHGAGIIHRDIKPGNIMITPEGEPVLMDFGLARDETSNHNTLTQSGDIFGTPAYMSPEQLVRSASSVDHRADLWAIGIIFYECLTRIRPFNAPTREGLYQAILTKEPADPRRLNPAVSEDLAVICETLLQKNPDQRYQTANDVAEELRRVQAFEPIQARRIGTLARAWRWAKRNRAVACLLAAVFVILAAGLGTSLYYLRESQNNASALESARQVAERRLSEFTQMSDAALAKRLLDEESELWPCRAHKVAPMTQWISEAQHLVQRLPRHQAARASLRRQASQPLSAQQQERNEKMRRRAHPEFYAELDRKRVWAADTWYWLRRVEDMLKGREAKGVATTDAERADRESLRANVEHDRKAARGLDAQVAALEKDPRYSEQLIWPLDNPDDQWRLSVLDSLTQDLTQLSSLIPSVEKRLAAASSMTRDTIEAHKGAWEACSASIAMHPSYGANSDLSEESLSILRALKPQEGMIPLGQDLKSGLWEFWLPETGTKPPWIVESGHKGHIDLDSLPHQKGVAIVMILVPGGSISVGTVPREAHHRYDPFAGQHGDMIAGTPNGDAQLNPFFISKFEWTQSQWQATGLSNESNHRIDNQCKHDVSLQHPVTDLSYSTAIHACARLGMELPTEAQWEYCARGGTHSPWWCGPSPESISENKAGNLSDETANDSDPTRFREYEEDLDDGWIVHAPVGSFSPNAFGLHDTIGNVREWCRDLFGYYYVPGRPGDALRQPDGTIKRMVRGGSFATTVYPSRSAHRDAQIPDHQDDQTGLRPVQKIR